MAYCVHMPLPGGGHAIVRMNGKKPVCVKCGRLATLECDWKVPPHGRKKSTTCDANLCERCTTKPSEGKDLCPPHAAAWAQWKAKRETSEGEA